MKTNNIEYQKKTDPSDPVEEITSIPRSVVAMAKDFPNGHLIPFHQHARSQLLYASSGVMTVTTANGIWVVPPLRAVWIPALACDRGQTLEDISTSERRGLGEKTGILSSTPSSVFLSKSRIWMKPVFL